MKRLVVLLVLLGCASLVFSRPDVLPPPPGAIVGTSSPCADTEFIKNNAGVWECAPDPGGGLGAPTTAEYWTGSADGGLSAEKNLGALSTGLVINTAGVPTAYTGGSCSDQFVRSFSAVGAPTCASVALTDLTFTPIKSGDAAGGDLAGTYPNPTIAANSVALGTDTTGDYVSDVTSNQGLAKTGTEGATVGLKVCADGEILKNSSGTSWDCAADAVGGGGGAPTDAQYITQTSNGTLSAEQALGSLASGPLINTTTTGVLSVEQPLAPGHGGTNSAFFGIAGPASSIKTFTFPNASATVLTDNAAVTVAQGGTGLTSGTSGGIPYFSGTTTLASSAALTANRLLLGGGAGASPTVLGSLGTTTTLLHGNASGAPTFAAVSLTADVTGILPGANGGSANGFFAVTGPASSLKTFTLPNASSTILTSNAAVTVAQGGTGLASGTSGGVPYFSGSTTLASSAALTSNAVMLGGGAGAAPTVVASLGTTGQVLTSNGAGSAPTFQSGSGGMCQVIPAVAAADDNMLLDASPRARTVTGVYCNYQGSAPTTAATFTLEDGSGNAMTITGTNPTCAAPGTVATVAAVTAGNALTAREVLRFDVTNTPNPATDTYILCVTWDY